MTSQSLPTFIGPRGDRLMVYCSLCGSPCSYDYHEYGAWLHRIVVLPLDWDGRSPAVEVKHVDTTVWDVDGGFVAWTNDFQPTRTPCIPMHGTCLDIAESVIKHKTKSCFASGGPPATMLQVHYVLLGRLRVSLYREEVGLYRLDELTGYGGIDKLQQAMWQNFDEEICKTWLMDPELIDISLSTAKSVRISSSWWEKSMDNITTTAKPDRIRLPLPEEIQWLIFLYTEDAPRIFPVRFWRRWLQSLPYLNDLPDNCEAFGRQVARVIRGEIVGGLTNRIRIWNLVSRMRLNDMYDLRVQFCTCEPICEVKAGTGDTWCEGTWEDWLDGESWELNEADPTSKDWKPLMRELTSRPLVVKDGKLVEPGDDMPIEDYIIDMDINASFRAWRNGRMATG